MANNNFVTAPSGEGFNRYCDIVRSILTAHKSIKDGIYNTSDSTTPKLDLVNAVKTITNLTDPDSGQTTRYSIDENGATSKALMTAFSTLRDKVTITYARQTADGVVSNAVNALQTHLKSLINNSDNVYYNSINQYYFHNINDASRSQFPAANLLNGGYYFNSDWNRLSNAAGASYSTTYDL